MVTTGSEDAWQRKAYISVETSATIKLQYEALTETIDIDTGERDLDVVNLLNLGQLPKHGAPGITTITFEGYPQQAGTFSTSGATRGTPGGGISNAYWDAFANVQNTDTSGEQDIDMATTLSRYRIAILWTDDPDVTGTASTSSDGTPSITGGAQTTNIHDGKTLTMTSGTASGGVYMIVSNNSTSVYTVTAGDTPNSDGVGTGTFTVAPTGSGAVDTGSKAKRFVMADAICTSCKTDFTDGILKQTLVFKGRAFDKVKATTIKMESATSSEKLTALGNYTPGSTYWA